MNNNGKLLLAALVGAACGAALGMLLAPERGNETRRRIADSANDLAGRLRKRVEDGLGGLSSVREGVSGVDEMDERDNSGSNYGRRASSGY